LRHARTRQAPDSRERKNWWTVDPTDAKKDRRRRLRNTLPRKQVVEPVFGQIKQARGFRQFLLRGIEKVRAEWAMICTAHNLLKLQRPREEPICVQSAPISRLIWTGS